MESYHYEWRVVHNGVGKVPNVRYDAASFFYNNCIWVACGGGSGLGKSSEVWKFDTVAKEWSKIDIPPNECPAGRDGHSGTYMGNGKYVIFGGQGFSEPNKKLGRESEQLKAQTHCKRDVFNDIWVFDCNSLKWSPIYPDGLNFPMGRRGHSAIYIPKQTLSREEEERAKLQKAQQRHPGHHHHHHHSTDEQSQSSFSGASSVASNSRAPSAASLHPRNNSSTSPSRQHHHRHETPAHTYEAIPENSLVIFGGAGIELSKYTEQLYNDLWVYSFDTNTWHKHETRGLEPNPTANHRVIRSGENMLIIGGIVGQPPELPGINTPPASAGGNNNNNNNNGALDGDIQVLNLRTATWSILRVLDHAGRPTKIGSLGFTVVPDVDLVTEHMTYVPPKSILVFGGKENVDSRLASTTKQTKRQQMIATSSLPCNARRLSPAQKRMIQHISEKTYAHFHPDGDLLDPWSVTDDHLMLLDIEQCTLTVLQTKMDGAPGAGLPVPPPEGRYAHMAVSAVAPKEYEEEQRKEQQAAEQGGASSSKYGGSRTARAGGGGATTRRNPFLTSSRGTARAACGLYPDGLPPEVPVMYIFGGCRLENNGYCDPIVFSLVKVFPPDKTQLQSMLTTGRSEATSFAGSNAGGVSPTTQPFGGKPLLLPITGRSMMGDYLSSGRGSPTADSPTMGDNDDFSRVSRDDHMFGHFGGGGDDLSSNHSGVNSPSSHHHHQHKGGSSHRGGLLEQSFFSGGAAAAQNHYNQQQQPLTSSSAAAGVSLIGSGSVSGLKAHSTVLQSMDLLAQPSIWNSLQKKEQLNDRDYETQPPANWDGMKLLLTASRSLRVVHGQVLTNNGPFASSSSSRLLQSPPTHLGGSGGGGGRASPSTLHHQHGKHSQSTSSLLLSGHDFAFRSVSSFNRGAPVSPFNAGHAMGTCAGLEGTTSSNNQLNMSSSTLLPRSAGNNQSNSTFSGVSPPKSRGSVSRGGQSPHALAASTSAMTLLAHESSAQKANKPMSAQSRALMEEARKERVQQIKKTLKPIITKQPKLLARETYKKMFPPPSDI